MKWAVFDDASIQSDDSESPENYDDMDAAYDALRVVINGGRKAAVLRGAKSVDHLLGCVIATLAYAYGSTGHDKTCEKVWALLDELKGGE